MKLGKLMICAGLAGLSIGLAGAAEETPSQRDARMQWWRDAKFGMFIHYGLYSGLEGKLDGKEYGGGAEWIQDYSGTESDKYAKMTLPLFKPQRGCASAWVKLAREAGCQYAVLTSKHHEGFALFDTRESYFNSQKTNGFDIVREFSDSCRKNGLKIGFYHSVIDWHHPNYDWKQAKGLPYPEGNKATHTELDHAKYQKFLHAQVNELVSNYGDIDILWWDYSSTDFDGEKAWRAPELIAEVRGKQPGIIMNNRLYASHNTDGPLVVTETANGDFTTPEQHIPDSGIPGDWEVCMTLNGTWGYAAHNHNWKSNDTLIRGLADTVSRGGNFLLNIGPKADGSLPEETVKSFKAISEWMKINSEAIYGTRANPFRHAFPWGVVTQKGEDLYLIIYEMPQDRLLKLPFRGEGKITAAALKEPSRLLPVKQGDNGLSIDLAHVEVVPSATVVKVSGRGEVIEGTFPEKGTFTLTPESAQLGDGQKLEKKEEKNHVGFWTEKVPLSWVLNGAGDGQYEVSICYSGKGETGHTPVKVSVSPGDSGFVWEVRSTGGWDTFKWEKVGTVSLPKGKSTITLQPQEKPAIGVANIREVILTPVKK